VIHFTERKRPDAQSSSDRMSSLDGTQDSCIAMDSMDSIPGVEPGNQDGQAKGRMATSVAPRMESGLTFLDESLSGTAGYDSPKEEAETSEGEVNKTAANKVEEAKTPEGISEYKKLRHCNIRKNNARFRAIGLDKSFSLKPKKAIKKKPPPSLSVTTKRNPSQVAKGTHSRSSHRANKKDSSRNDKEVQEEKEEEEETSKAARRRCPRNDDTLSKDNEEEEEEDDSEEMGEINKGVARKNPLSADDDSDTDDTYEDNKGTEEDEENIEREEDEDDDNDDPKLKRQKSRAKMKMPLDNESMPKNKKGYCIISKKSFDPEKGMNKGIDEKRISAYLGSIDIKYSEPAQYKKILEWFQKFRIQLGNRARVRII
jgi:hypothetical protein